MSIGLFHKQICLPDLRGDSSTTLTDVLLWDRLLSASCRFHMAEFFCLCEGVSATRVFLTGDLKGGDIRSVKTMYMYIV